MSASSTRGTSLKFSLSTNRTEQSALKCRPECPSRGLNRIRILPRLQSLDRRKRRLAFSSSRAIWTAYCGRRFGGRLCLYFRNRKQSSWGRFLCSTATSRGERLDLLVPLLTYALCTSCSVLFGTRNIPQTNSRNPILPSNGDRIPLPHRNVRWDLGSAVNSTAKGHHIFISADLCHSSFRIQIRRDFSSPSENYIYIYICVFLESFGQTQRHLLLQIDSCLCPVITFTQRHSLFHNHRVEKHRATLNYPPPPS